MATAEITNQGLEVAAPVRPRVAANLSLAFEREAASGRTMLKASTQEPPLRVVRAFAREDGSSLAHLHNVSGGLLGGDRLSLSVALGARAQVQLTTAGATRIYRPAPNAAQTEQTNRICLGEEALLEYVPDAIIPYAGVRFLQSSHIQMAAGAGLFWWEILTPGREARGESFAYERLEMHTDIFAGERLIAAERVRLEPTVRRPWELARLGAYPYWVTFYVCRMGVDAPRWLALEEEIRAAAREWVAPDEMLWGVSALPAHGLAIRGLARQGQMILPVLRSLWSTAKIALYGREPVLPRKVN